jgi:NDP-sugar pyrophosphorylase family protein
MINVIVLLAGEGKRFKDANYVLPKPLIPVNGKPMITRAIESLDIDGRYCFVVRKDEHLQQTLDAIKQVVTDPVIIEVDKTTEGAAASALLLEQHIDPDDELIIVNCDQIMNWESEHAIKCLRKFDGALVTIKSTDHKHSFARVENRLVTEVVEKNPISDCALTGIHYWNRAEYFFSSAKQMIQNNDRTNNEFYVGPTYNYLISHGLDIGMYEITSDEFYPVGTPHDLERYLNESK